MEVFNDGLLAGIGDVQAGEAETFGCRQQLWQGFDRQAQHIQIDQPVETTQALVVAFLLVQTRRARGLHACADEADEN